MHSPFATGVPLALQMVFRPKTSDHPKQENLCISESPFVILFGPLDQGSQNMNSYFFYFLNGFGFQKLQFLQFIQSCICYKAVLMVLCLFQTL